jgi:putative transposase
MRRIDEIYTEVSSFYGYRRMHVQLQDEGFSIGHNKVHRLMKRMGIEGQRPQRRIQTGLKAKENETYPYRLETLKNEEGQVIASYPNQIRSGDITYIPIRGGFMYLTAIIDRHSRAVLAWRLSNTMDASPVTGVLEEAITKHGKPEIFNSDQGSRYTGKEHTGLLKKHQIAISMNGKGRSIDNIIIERFFRTLKYEEVYVKEYENVKALKEGIRTFIEFYNFNRLHSALKYDRPMNVYRRSPAQAA